MPSNCPKSFLEYNDCEDCTWKDGTDCWTDRKRFGRPVPLLNILTDDERLRLLEDNVKHTVEVTTIPRHLYDQQMTRLIEQGRNLTLLERTLKSHISNRKDKDYY